MIQKVFLSYTYLEDCKQEIIVMTEDRIGFEGQVRAWYVNVIYLSHIFKEASFKESTSHI